MMLIPTIDTYIRIVNDGSIGVDWNRRQKIVPKVSKMLTIWGRVFQEKKYLYSLHHYLRFLLLGNSKWMFQSQRNSRIKPFNFQRFENKGFSSFVYSMISPSNNVFPELDPIIFNELPIYISNEKFPMFHDFPTAKGSWTNWIELL